MSSQRVVFDCNVFAQALLNTTGPAGACIVAALDGTVVLCLSKLRVLAEIVDEPPVLFLHPIDPKDGPYIDLAIATGATVITSRDKHLLNLMNPAKAWSADFRSRFPRLRVISTQAFLREIRAEAGDLE